MTALPVLSNGLVIVLLKSSRRPYRDVTAGEDSIIAHMI